MNKNKNLLLAVTGGISAYKSCEILRLFKKEGINVYVIMTENATKFVTPLTFKVLSENPVFIDMFSENKEFSLPHISLSKICKVMLIAPATANIIAKIANGIADDLVSTIALAFSKNIYIAPAMNSEMFKNIFFQENLKKLKIAKNIKIIEPDEGELACGDIGVGRLADINKIFQIVIKEFK